MATFYFGVQPTTPLTGSIWFLPTASLIELISYEDNSYVRTSGGITLVSFYDTVAEHKTIHTWNSSTGSDYIYLEPIATEVSLGSWGIATFEGHTFNLGLGNDVFIFDYYGIYAPYSPASIYGANASYRYSSNDDAVLEGGYSFTVNAGGGQDIIHVEYESSDYYLDRTLISTGATTKTLVSPRVVANGDAGDDDISSEGFALTANGGTGADIITSDFLSDRIIGGDGNDFICGAFYDTEDFIFSLSAFRIAQSQKDLLTGGLGKDTFLIGALGNTYGINANNDFAVITDFGVGDRISTVLYRGDLVIEGNDGELSLGATSAYAATTVNYTARLYIDSDASNAFSTGDELIAYVTGVQPTAGSFIYGV